MKQIWYRIKQFIDTNFTVARIKLIGRAINDPPYDWSYLLKLEQAKLIEMRDYFMMTSHDFDHRADIKWINICINLIDIIAEQPEDHPYVNVNNMWRFIRSTDYVNGVIKEDVEDYYKSYPQDLRWVKAEHLYYEIRKRYTSGWWD
jgi:hypothetical protein